MLLLAGWLALFPWMWNLRGAEEMWTCPHCDCNRQVTVQGEFHHLSGTAAGIRGRQFLVSVPHLDPGNYRVTIGVPEDRAARPGGDLFGISCMARMLLRNISPVKHRETVWTRGLRFPGNGPMVLGFKTLRGEASLGSLEIVNDQGQSVVSMEMQDLKPLR